MTNSCGVASGSTVRRATTELRTSKSEGFRLRWLAAKVPFATHRFYQPPAPVQRLLQLLSEHRKYNCHSTHYHDGTGTMSGPWAFHLTTSKANMTVALSSRSNTFSRTDAAGALKNPLILAPRSFRGAGMALISPSRCSWVLTTHSKTKAAPYPARPSEVKNYELTTHLLDKYLGIAHAYNYSLEASDHDRTTSKQD